MMDNSWSILSIASYWKIVPHYRFSIVLEVFILVIFFNNLETIVCASSTPHWSVTAQGPAEC